ncbi:MAG: Flp pilus assembly protein CpaB [Kiritimatiellae bacterium]|nr:Flp pilus assembly protein CpaB [Kiritimatiellia bacterium]
MKNVVPLIMAVVLGLAAVYGVTRLISSNAAEEEKKFVNVVAAARDIVYKDGEIKDSWIKKKRVEISSLPAKAILWKQANMVIGQTVTRTVARNDYILTSDISGVDVRLANAVGAGEWAVPVSFADSKLVKFLKPGDEIAIMCASSIKKVVSSRDQSLKSTEVKQDTMSVLFPCVRILDVGRGDALRRSEDVSGETIILALTPRQAMTIVAAQREMDLYPALRRANDANALRRRDVGMVDEKTFQELKQNLETVVLPDGTEK